MTLHLSTSTDGEGDPILFYSMLASSGDSSSYNRLWVNFYGSPDEKIYGGGEQFTYFNLKGHSFPLWTSEQGTNEVNSGSLTSVDLKMRPLICSNMFLI